MYNSDIPTRKELPSSAQLIKSTIIAIIAAIVILITIVLPAEFGIDPTGIGKVFNLTEMGEIKQQLAEEAQADREQQKQENNPDSSSSLMNNLMSIIVPTTQAQEQPKKWTDQFTYTLKRGEGIEVKLVMNEGAQAEFLWKAEGGKLNYDLHGDGSGNKISYKKGRGVPGDEGTLQAAFTGNHGWFWRNRERQPVTFTLLVRGAYSKLVLPK